MIEIIIPSMIRRSFYSEIKYLGIEDYVSYFRNIVKVLLLVSFLSTLLIFFIYFKQKLNIPGLIISYILFFFFYLFIAYQIVKIGVTKRTKEIEVTLPDALFLLASNLRAGMTIDRALWRSARKEFGIVGAEFERAARELSAGVPLPIVFRRIGERHRSDNLKRVVNLIIQGVISGASLAPLLERIAIDLRTEQAVEKEASTSLKTYIYFIIMASAVIGPILFALSISLIELMTGMTARLGEAELEEAAKSLGLEIPIITGAKSRLTPEQLRDHAFITVAIINIVSSFVLAEIKDKKYSLGVRYMPFLVLCSLTIFFIVHKFAWAYFSRILR